MSSGSEAGRVRLVAPDRAPSARPALDDDQRRVVEHPGGPLLVLAGPGTGKTTTMVEAIAHLIEERGADPASVLALTFSRKAAEELRDRVGARLGRTLESPIAATFHSFAYRLISAYSPAELYSGPLRLLSAPEQDVVLRELLTAHTESVVWPEGLERALGTRGFAREVQAVLGRAREKGLDGEALSWLGRQHDLPEFVAAGHFLEQYLTILDSLGATDYSDLIRRARIDAEAHRDELRQRYRHVFVDEYQDTDPGQVELLRTLAGDGRDLVVVGDPNQSIYAFRGAEVRSILEFPTQFPTVGGAPAPVIALRTTRRFGSRLLTTSQRVASRLTLPGSIPDAAKEAFLSPVAAANPHGPGSVEVRTFATDRGEAEHLADLLRRAHLQDDIDWSDMAVLVRSGRTSIPSLRRLLGAAGVPVEVAADETPLVRDPAVRPLLDALRAVLELDNDDPATPGYLDPGRIEALLLSPVGDLDAGAVRRLGRLLRARDRATQPSPRGSRALLRLAVVDEHFLDDLTADHPEAARAAALARLLAAAQAQQQAGASAEEVLWQVWSGTRWPERLRALASRGGAGARRANRDLDSVVALFEAAARAEERRDHTGIRNFLETLVAQEIPADTLAERGVRGSAVRLLTAHRAKGLEWRLVVVAHVQADGWPDLRRRSTLLQADRIGSDAVVPPVGPRALLMEERRLFYVACTRARERLVVTAVASTDPDGEQPSRFLDELGLGEPLHLAGRPARPLSMVGLVAELRRTLADPETSAPMRAAAARRLARLALESDDAGRPLVVAADPAAWWGSRDRTRSAVALRSPDAPVSVSATLLKDLAECPAKHFFEREAGGSSPRDQYANIGQLLHALAEGVATGELPSDDTPDRTALSVLMAQVELVWPRLVFRTPWSSDRERRRVERALERFLVWHRTNPRETLAVERRFTAVVELPGGERVRLGGYADRLELDADGRVQIVDFKTGRGRLSGPQVRADLQLALYQLATDSGGFDEVVPEPHRPAASGGAMLLQLGIEDDKDALEQRQDAQTDDSDERLVLLDALTRAGEYLREEHFPARPGSWCDRCDFPAICPAVGARPVVE